MISHPPAERVVVGAKSIVCGCQVMADEPDWTCAGYQIRCSAKALETICMGELFEFEWNRFSQKPEAAVLDGWADSAFCEMMARWLRNTRSYRKIYGKADERL
jgi:hypothetical protein